MFDNPTLFPGLVIEQTAPPRVLQRQRTHVCDQFVRKVKGNSYQLRLWLPRSETYPACSVNCGLYRTEEEAIAAKGELEDGLEGVRAPLTPMKVWLAMKPLIASGIMPLKLLPMWTFRVRGKVERFAAKVKVGGVNLSTRTYPTPEQAHRAIAARLADMVGKGEDGEPRMDLGGHYRKWRADQSDS